MMAKKTYTVHFVQCRLLGHAWDEIPSDLSIKGKRVLTGERMSFRCVRCQTVREEVWNIKGELSMRRYIYADNYQFGKGGRIYAPQFRQTYLSERKKSGAEVLSYHVRTPIGKVS